MKRKKRIFSVAAFLLLAPAVVIVLTSGIRNKAPLNNKKPNIVYVLTDEWRAQATGYAGDPNVKTPNLDLLASQSVNFSNAISVLPVCTPHRAALLTGRYPQSTGMIFNDLYLPAGELTMAEIFNKAGYNTAYIGKWHLDGHGRMSYIPKERRQGFEYWKANECTHNYNHSKYFANEDTTARFWKGYDVYDQTKDAEQYINQQAKSNNPFILVLAYGAPHFPHDQAPENIKKRYKAESIVLRPNVSKGMVVKAQQEAVGYYAHCTAIDSCIGVLRKTIKAAGINDNTIFIFTSDHGEMLGSHDVEPEAKQRPWDESIKVPFLFHYPALAGKLKQNIQVPINTPDILPTLLGMSGIEKPATIEGEDLSDLIAGKKTLKDRAALFMNMAPFSENFEGKEYRGIRTSRYTYVRNLDGPWLLFDNQKDPYQMKNLVNDPGQKVLKSELDNQLKEKLSERNDEFKAREFYIKKWGYKVNPKRGDIPYGRGPYEAQFPNKVN